MIANPACPSFLPLAPLFLFRGYKYRRLDGSTNRIQRMIDIEVFNKPNSDIFIYILCTRAGGLGVRAGCKGGQSRELCEEGVSQVGHLHPVHKSGRPGGERG